MTSTRSAHATGLPALRSVAIPELEGTALRLHVAPVVTARWLSGPRGYALVTLAAGDDPDEPAALVRLPLAQAEALAKACAAFNVILEAADRDVAPPWSVPRTQGFVTAAAQVAILAAFLPAVVDRCRGLL